MVNGAIRKPSQKIRVLKDKQEFWNLLILTNQLASSIIQLYEVNFTLILWTNRKIATWCPKFSKFLKKSLVTIFSYPPFFYPHEPSIVLYTYLTTWLMDVDKVWDLGNLPDHQSWSRASTWQQHIPSRSLCRKILFQGAVESISFALCVLIISEI